MNGRKIARFASTILLAGALTAGVASQASAAGRHKHPAPGTVVKVVEQGLPDTTYTFDYEGTPFELATDSNGAATMQLPVGRQMVGNYVTLTQTGPNGLPLSISCDGSSEVTPDLATGSVAVMIDYRTGTACTFSN